MVKSTLVHFGVSGAKNDGLADFTKLVIFMAKLIQDKELYALHQESKNVPCFIQREASDLTILSLIHRPVQLSENFESKHELSGNALIDELCMSNAIFVQFK